MAAATDKARGHLRVTAGDAAPRCIGGVSTCRTSAIGVGESADTMRSPSGSFMFSKVPRSRVDAYQAEFFSSCGKVARARWPSFHPGNAGAVRLDSRQWKRPGCV